MKVIIQTFFWDSNYWADVKTVSLFVNLIIVLMQKILSSIAPPYYNFAKIMGFFY